VHRPTEGPVKAQSSLDRGSAAPVPALCREVELGSGRETILTAPCPAPRRSARIQTLLADALRGCFQAVPAEARDRISCEQEDVADEAHGVCRCDDHDAVGGRDHAPARGPRGHLALPQLADKTQRGMLGRVEQGRRRPLSRLRRGQRSDAAGDPVRGERPSNEVRTYHEVMNRQNPDVVPLRPRPTARRWPRSSGPSPGSLLPFSKPSPQVDQPLFRRRGWRTRKTKSGLEPGDLLAQRLHLQPAADYLHLDTANLHRRLRTRLWVLG